jgi:FtsZ-binding cell division protein ZapB
MTKEYELQLAAWQKNEDYTEGLRLWAQRYGENMAYKMLCMGANDFNRAKLRAGLAEPFDVPVVVPDPVKKKIGKVARLEETVDELESELSDVSDTVYDVKDTVDNLTENVENLEGSMMDLSDRVEQFLAKAPEVQVVKLTSAESRRQNLENEPEDVRNWHKSTYELMDERVLLKQRLRDLPDPQRREDRRVAAYRILDITAELDILFGQIAYWEEHGRVPSNQPLENQDILYPKRYMTLRTYVTRTTKKLKNAQTKAEKKKWQDELNKWLQEMKQIEIEL